MTPAILRKAMRIKAPAARVWQYIGTEAGLRQWWGTDISLEAKVGGACEERSHVPGARYHLRGTVTAYTPPRHLALALRNMDDGASWPALTTLHITLEEEGEETLVTLVHQAFGPLTGQLQQMDDDASSQAAEPDNPVITNQLLPGRTPTPQGACASMPAASAWSSSRTRHLPLVGNIPPAPGRRRWLEVQETGWAARVMRLTTVSTERTT